MPINEKQQPTAVDFWLCEEVRQELGGKYSLLGIFAGGDIRLAHGTFKEGLALPSLCVFARLVGGHGAFKQKVTVEMPGLELMEALEGDEVELKAGVPHVATFAMKPFPIKSLGEYAITYSLDDVPYRFPFVIHEKSAEQA